MLTIRRKKINGQVWFQVMELDHIYFDWKMVCALVDRGIKVIDLDAVKLEREYQAKWN